MKQRKGMGKWRSKREGEDSDEWMADAGGNGETDRQTWREKKETTAQKKRSSKIK